MEEQPAAEIEGKIEQVDRGGAGDCDNNMPVPSCSNVGNAVLYDTNAPLASLLSEFPPTNQKPSKSMMYKAYDKTRRTRTFVPHWVVEYPWLEFNAEKDCMYCVYCREYWRTHDIDFTNTFVHGATNFRLDSVKAHDGSAKHRQVMLVMSGKAIPKTRKPPVKLTPKNTDRLRVLFMTANSLLSDQEMNSELPSLTTVLKDMSEKFQDENDHVMKSVGSMYRASVDLTDEPVYPSNHIGQYLQSLQNLYTQIPANFNTTEAGENMNMASSGMVEPHPRDESSISSSPEKRQQLPPGLPPPPLLPMSSHPQDDKEDGNRPSPKEVSGPEVIGRSVMRMKPVWQTVARGWGKDNMEAETSPAHLEIDETSNPQTSLKMSHTNIEPENKGASDYQNDEVTDYFGSTAWKEQRGRKNLMEPKAKRQRLEELIDRQLYHGQVTPNENGIDSSGEEVNQSNTEMDQRPVNTREDHLDDSLASKYSQLYEEHIRMINQFQEKIHMLETRCSELEHAAQNSRTETDTSPNAEISNESSRQQGRVETTSSAPKININSSVVVLQLQGRDPICIGDNSNATMNNLQQNLAKSGIHISLHGSAFPPVCQQDNVASTEDPMREEESNSTRSASLLERELRFGHSGQVVSNGCDMPRTDGSTSSVPSEAEILNTRTDLIKEERTSPSISFQEMPASHESLGIQHSTTNCNQFPPNDNGYFTPQVNVPGHTITSSSS